MPSRSMEAILFATIVLCFYSCSDGFIVSKPSSTPLYALNRVAKHTSSGCSSLRQGKMPLTMQHEASIPGTWTLSGELEGKSSFAVLNLYSNRTANAPVLVEELWRGGRGIWKINGVEFALEVHKPFEIHSCHRPRVLKTMEFAFVQYRNHR